MSRLPHGAVTRLDDASTKRSLSVAPSAPPSNAPELLTPDEVAKVLRTTRGAVYAHVSRGSLPGVIRLGRRILFDRVELLNWLRHKSIAITTEKAA